MSIKGEKFSFGHTEDELLVLLDLGILEDIFAEKRIEEIT